MDTIRESRVYAVENKIIKVTDIQSVAQFLYSECDLARRQTLQPNLRFEITCNDGSMYEFSDVSIFTDSRVSIEVPIKIDMNLSIGEHGKNIHVSLRAAEQPSKLDNYVSVSGFDPTWVAGILGRLSLLVDSIQPQSENRRVYFRIVYYASALLIGRVVMFFALLFGNHPDMSSMSQSILTIRQLIHSSPFVYEFLLYAYSFLIGLVPARLVRNKFEKLWPDVEFQIGPEHKYRHEKKRKKLVAVVTFIFLPLLMTLAYDILKYLFRP